MMALPVAIEIGHHHDVPQHVLQSLPGEDISITKFLAWSLPPCTPINTCFTCVENFLLPLMPNAERFEKPNTLYN